jgi:hypothetical protein
MTSFRQILQVGLPATITNVLGPIATAMLTAIVALHGAEAVAAYGIGARVEALVLIAPIALSSGLSPFVGQNWGAHLEDRVAKGFSVAVRFSILWGLGALLLLLPTAPLIAKLFSADQTVQADIVIYLRVVPIGYAAYSVMMMVSSAFNAMDHATRSTALSVIRSIALAVPLAWLGGRFLGLYGIFIGLVIASLVAAVLGLRWMRMFLSPEAHKRIEADQLTEDARFLLDKSPAALREPLQALIEEIQPLEHVELHRIRGDAVGFFVGKRQLGHMHASGHFDLPLPFELAESLVQRGKVEHHRMHNGSGWYTHAFHDSQSIVEITQLLRLAHVLYEMRLRGAEAEQTQAELATLQLSPTCVAALERAASRWTPAP